jgi:hypothetical protein
MQHMNSDDNIYASARAEGYRVPAIRTPTWQDPVIATLDALHASIPPEEADLHRRLRMFVSEVEYTAWQPTKREVGPSLLGMALGFGAGGTYWSNWVGALLSQAFRITLNKPEYRRLKDAIAVAMTELPSGEPWMSENDNATSTECATMAHLYLEHKGGPYDG